MDYKHKCDTIFTYFQSMTNNIYGFGRFFCSFIFLPVHHISTRPYSFFTRPNIGRMGLYIKLCQPIKAIRPTDLPNIGLHICVVVLQCGVNRQVNRILAFLRVVLMNEHRMTSDIGASWIPNDNHILCHCKYSLCKYWYTLLHCVKWYNNKWTSLHWLSSC